VVRPGDIIVADANGMVCVPRESAEWVLREAAELRARFDKIQPILERGEVTGIDAIVKGFQAQGFAIDPGGTPPHGG
jgi:regulator of RNase E activity RraA